MRRKTGLAWGARINADIRRGRHIAGRAKRADIERRPRLPDRLPRGTNVEPGPKVVDDFFQAIPVAQRELDVIETYLGALLDDALGEPE
jgi:hypothetical protein